MSFTPIPNPQPGSIADGSDVAIGATTDAAISTDTTGTISGKLRGFVKILANVWDSTAGRLKVATVVSDATTPSNQAKVTNAAPASTDYGLVVRGTGEFNTHSMPIELVATLHGDIHGKTAYTIHVMGSRSQGWSSTSVLGDAAEYLDTSQPRINAVSTGTTYYLRSSSANDDGSPAGTGAQTVRIFYLDSSGNMQTRTDTLNGTTPVYIGSGYSYFMWAEVAAVGSNTVSAGNITISSNAGGAPAVSEIVEYIAAGGNRSLSGRIKIPTGYTGYLIDWDCRAISNTMDVRLRGDFFTDITDGASSGVFHFLDRAFLASGGDSQRNMHYKKVPSGCEVKVSAFPGGAPAGNKLDCDFDLIIIAD